MVNNMFRISLLEEGADFVDLVGRRPTIPIKEKVIEVMESAPTGTVFFYDFNEVREINGSGVHEVIVKPIEWLCENYKSHDKYLFLKNLSRDYDHLYNIQITCNKEKVAVVAQQEKSHTVIGDKAGEALVEILDLVYQRKEITAREVVDVLDKKLNLASTQLTKLFEMRLVSRREEQLEEGGRQFIYSSLF